VSGRGILIVQHPTMDEHELLEQHNRKGIFMKHASVAKLAAAMIVLGLAGCQDLKPIQTDIDDIKVQVNKIQSDLTVVKNAADQANSAALMANQAANEAQGTANKALAAAQAAQSSSAELNEKIDRMFKRSLSK
jgi:murein lipoprotein